MNLSTRTISGPLLSRRQFGLVVGGGAFLLVAGGTYGVISRSGQDSGGSVATAFGTLSVLRAGRLARLDSQGRTAFRTVTAAAAQLTGGTGSAAAFSGGPSLRRVDSSRKVSTDSHSHDGGTLPDSASQQPANLTWGDVVVLEVELNNTMTEPMLFGPGQLRLKLLPSAMTVTPQDSGRGPGALSQGTTEHLWISYLAPHDSVDMELEYSDPVRDQTLALALPPLTINQGRP
ncbi:hypothetical protein V3C33_12240 [Micrococcaceae bacterium Sec5.7]